MNPDNLREYLSPANELGLKLFICGQDLLSWQYMSDPLLDMFGITMEDVKNNPRIWMNRIQGINNEEIEKALLITDTTGKCFDLQFQISEYQRILLKFSRQEEDTSGTTLYLGSVEKVSGEEKYKHEAILSRDYAIEISARIQRALLTKPLVRTIGILELAAESLPSREVDGDFYEFTSITPDTLEFITGDVMGKGVPAALLAAAVKSSFFKALITLSVTKEEIPGISQIMKEIDHSINRELMELENFLTLYYSRFNMKTSVMEFIDAGHTSFIYLDSEEESCWSVKGSNMPVGFSSQQIYREYSLPFYRNDLLFFYSDGITELENSEHMQFGQERLKQLIHAHRHLEPQELLKKIMNIAFYFSAEGFSDDVTAVVVKSRGEAPEPLIQREYRVTVRDNIDSTGLRESLEQNLFRYLGNPDRDEISGTVIAFMEALSNILRHTESEFKIKWNIYADQCRIIMTFKGPGFDWYESELPEIKTYRENGFGNYLISEGVDSYLLLQGTGNINRLIMIKDFK